MIRIEATTLSRRDLLLIVLSIALVPVLSLATGVLIGLGSAREQAEQAVAAVPEETIPIPDATLRDEPAAATAYRGSLSSAGTLSIAAPDSAAAIQPETSAMPDQREDRAPTATDSAASAADDVSNRIVALQDTNTQATAADTVAASLTLPSGTQYAVQAGCFARENNAQRLQQALRARGITSSVHRTGDNSRPGFRVVLSTFPDRAQARKEESRLRSAYKLELTVARIVLPPSETRVAAL